MVWDIPGCGTRDHPVATYFKREHLAAFDCLVLVAATATLGEYERHILQEIDKSKTSVIIVINKRDGCIEPKCRKKFGRHYQPALHDYKLIITEIINEAKTAVQDSLLDLNLTQTPEVFAISAYNYRDYMFRQTKTELDELFTFEFGDFLKCLTNAAEERRKKNT
ncbi:unnamed protein product [Didymodactylos carnosus]|nr:unnamed protein product [Didymodactylos carnosus]CAF4366205.1 unnamed protein product [Didymodactylos carnosus]